MRKLMIGAVIAMCGLFIAGGVAAYMGQVDKELYIVATGVVGGLASVIGLIGLLAKPANIARDMKQVEVELVRGLADTMKTVSDYEARASQGKQDIDRLTRERAEMELLIRQASVKVFMEEKLKSIAQEVDTRIMKDTRLEELLDEYRDATKQVKNVDGQLAASGRADLIRQILDEVPRPRRSIAAPSNLSEAIEAVFDILNSLLSPPARRR